MRRCLIGGAHRPCGPPAPPPPPLADQVSCRLLFCVACRPAPLAKGMAAPAPQLRRSRAAVVPTAYQGEGKDAPAGEVRCHRRTAPSGFASEAILSCRVCCIASVCCRHASMPVLSCMWVQAWATMQPQQGCPPSRQAAPAAGRRRAELPNDHVHPCPLLAWQQTAAAAAGGAAAGVKSLSELPAYPGDFVRRRLITFVGIVLGYSCFYLTRNSLTYTAPVMVRALGAALCFRDCSVVCCWAGKVRVCHASHLPPLSW